MRISNQHDLDTMWIHADTCIWVYMEELYPRHSGFSAKIGLLFLPQIQVQPDVSAWSGAGLIQPASSNTHEQARTVKCLDNGCPWMFCLKCLVQVMQIVPNILQYILVWNCKSGNCSVRPETGPFFQNSEHTFSFAIFYILHPSFIRPLQSGL